MLKSLESAVRESIVNAFDKGDEVSFLYNGKMRKGRVVEYKFDCPLARKGGVFTLAIDGVGYRSFNVDYVR